jgi:8-oxo-dGTP diphosphatase
MNDRSFPARPIVVVSAAVFLQGRALIFAGRERRCLAISTCLAGASKSARPLAAALVRELMEGVGIESEILVFNRHVEAIGHEGSRIRTHFVIASFVVRCIWGEPRLSEEVDAVDRIDPAASLPSPMTPQLSEVLMSAVGIEGRRT